MTTSREIENAKLVVSVESDITESIATYYRWWRIWSLTDSIVTIAAIVASFAAGAFAAGSPIDNKLFAATLAAIPGLLLTIDQAFKFRDRSNWFWTLVLRYQSLQRALERDDVTYPEASRKIDEIEDEANSNDPCRFKSISPPRGFKE